MTSTFRRTQMAAAGSGSDKTLPEDVFHQRNVHLERDGNVSTYGSGSQQLRTGIDMRGTPSTTVNDYFSEHFYNGNDHGYSFDLDLDMSSSQGNSPTLIVKANGGSYWCTHGVHQYIHSANSYESSSSNSQLQYTNKGFKITGPGVGNAGSSPLVAANVQNTGLSSYFAFTFKDEQKFNSSDGLSSRFFTYTGDGTNNRQILHGYNGTWDGIIIIKRQDAAQGAFVVNVTDTTVHGGAGHNVTMTNTYGSIGTTNGNTNSNILYQQGWITSNDFRSFTVGNTASSGINNVNENGVTYRVWMFYNDGTRQKIGTWSNDGAAAGPAVTLGWQPQFLMIKSLTDSSSSWNVYSRQLGGATYGTHSTGTNSSGHYLDLLDSTPLTYANTSNGNNTKMIKWIGSGFGLNATWNQNTTQPYLYWAIRDPEYTFNTEQGGYIETMSRAGTPNMYAFSTAVYGSNDNPSPTSGYNRPQGYMYRNGSHVGSRGYCEQSDFVHSVKKKEIIFGDFGTYDFQNNPPSGNTASDQMVRVWKQKEKFFKQFLYTGTGSDQNLSHTLGCRPGMIQVQRVNGGGKWWTNTGGSTAVNAMSVCALLDPATGKYYVSNLQNGDEYISFDNPGGSKNSKLLSVSESDSLATSTIFNPNNMAWNSNGPGFDNANSNVLNYKYLVTMWAHDTSADSIIKCGIYQGGNEFNTVNVGFMPQYVLIKHISGSSTNATNCGFHMFDDVGGMGLRTGTSGGSGETFMTYPKSGGPSGGVGYHSGHGLEKISGLGNTQSDQGFGITASSGATSLYDGTNFSTSTYWYMAVKQNQGKENYKVEDFCHIAKGNYVNTSGFSPKGQKAGKGVGAGFQIGWTPNLYIYYTSSAQGFVISDASAEEGLLLDSDNNSSGVSSYNSWSRGAGTFTTGNGIGSAAWTTNSANIYNDHYMLGFRRMPGVFDIVAYNGNSTGRKIAHNLGVQPDMIWWFNYEFTGNMRHVWTKGLSNNPQLYVRLGSAQDVGTYQPAGNLLAGAPGINYVTNEYIELGTSTQVNAGNPADSFFMCLFASKPGISKVGTYYGNSQTTKTVINLGFNKKPWFVISKNVTQGATQGNWYINTHEGGQVNFNSRFFAASGSFGSTWGMDDIYDNSYNAGGFSISGNSNVNTNEYIYYAVQMPDSYNDANNGQYIEPEY